MLVNNYKMEVLSLILSTRAAFEAEYIEFEIRILALVTSLRRNNCFITVCFLASIQLNIASNYIA